MAERKNNPWTPDDVRELLDFVIKKKNEGIVLDDICEQYRLYHPERTNLSNSNIKAVYYRYKDLSGNNSIFAYKNDYITAMDYEENLKNHIENLKRITSFQRTPTSYTEWTEEELEILKNEIEKKDPQKSLGSVFLELSQRLNRSPESIKQQYYKFTRKNQRQRDETPKAFDLKEMYEFLDSFDSNTLKNLQSQIKMIVQMKKKNHSFDVSPTIITITSLNMDDEESVYDYFDQMNITELNAIITEIEVILLERQKKIDNLNPEIEKTKVKRSYSMSELYDMFNALNITELEKVSLVIDILKYNK